MHQKSDNLMFRFIVKVSDDMTSRMSRVHLSDDGYTLIPFQDHYIHDHTDMAALKIHLSLYFTDCVCFFLGAV